MPFFRVAIACGLCGHSTPIVLGNPQLATQSKDSPLELSSRGGVIFHCAHCRAQIRIPLRPEEDTPVD